MDILIECHDEPGHEGRRHLPCLRTFGIDFDYGDDPVRTLKSTSTPGMIRHGLWTKYRAAIGELVTTISAALWLGVAAPGDSSLFVTVFT